MRYIRWFASSVRPYWLSMSVMMLCHVLLACCSIAFVYVSKKLVDVAVAILSGNEVVRALSIWAVAMIMVFIIRIALNALRSFLQVRTEMRLKNSIRKRVFDILLHIRNEGGSRHHSGDILNRIQEDVRVVSNAMAVSIPNLFGTVLQFAAALVFLLILDLRLAVLILIVLPIGILTGKFISARIRNLTLDIRKSDSKVQSHLQESIQHLTILQSLEHTDNTSSELGELQSMLYDKEMRRTRFSLISRIFISLAFQAGHTIAFLWGVYGISNGTVTYGMMTAFLQLVGQIQRPMMDISSQVPSIIHATASIDRIMELESLPCESVSNPVFLSGPAGIRISNLEFSYPDSDQSVFDDFSFVFEPGSRTAIVGHTGVGKSTLIRLLLSLLQPQKGKIELFDGEVVVEASVSTRCNLIYVPQGNTLFSGTIKDNLLMGNPEATYEQLNEALHTAAADFVFDLPSGIETQCFEAGAGLSEGQAQRIAIARALLRPGSILLLDEFSSALDANTEQILLDRLTKRLSDHTMIFITHRKKIIEYCDDILKIGD